MNYVSKDSIKLITEKLKNNEYFQNKNNGSNQTDKCAAKNPAKLKISDNKDLNNFVTQPF